MPTYDRSQFRPLGPYTTFAIGGPAETFIEAPPVGHVLAEVWAAYGSEPIFVLGGGSNLLVSDDGYPGVVLKLCGDNRCDLDPDGQVVVGADFSWDELVMVCAEAHLQGIEMTAGIPGSVGGAVVQNAGAYGQYVEDVLVSVRCFDRETAEEVVLSKADCRFGYRTSIFRLQLYKYVILDVTLRFSRAPRIPIAMQQLLSILVGEFGEPSAPTFKLAAVTRAIRRYRYLQDHIATPTCLSAGSFFLNYLVEEGDTARYRIQEAFTERKCLLQQDQHTWVDKWDAYSDRYQYLFAGSLIGTACQLDQNPLEFCPGSEHGPLRLGAKSSNTIINKGSASATDIVELARRMRDNVESIYGITLTPEVLLLGPPGFDRL